MKAAPTLNEARAHAWAGAVSGTAWKAHTLTPGGVLSAEYVRGPLIVWATKPDEGEYLPAPHTPTPLPLEVAAARLNMRPHFQAFVRAARGKVRHSVRWKTGRKARGVRKLEALRRVRDVAHLIARRAAGLTGITGRPADPTVKGRRAARRDVRAERLEDLLRQIAPAPEAPGGYWADGLEAELWAMKAEPDPETWYGDAALSDLLALACANGDRRGIREVLEAPTFGRKIAAYELALPCGILNVPLTAPTSPGASGLSRAVPVSPGPYMRGPGPLPVPLLPLWPDRRAAGSCQR